MLTFFVLCFGVVNGAAEQSKQRLESQQQQTIDTQLQIANEVESPLVMDTNSQPHATISVLAYSEEHNYYPIRILTINKFAIDPLRDGYRYPLKAGTYQFEILPDLTLLHSNDPVHAIDWQPKRLTLQVSSDKTYVLGARLSEYDSQEWQAEVVQLMPVISNNN